MLAGAFLAGAGCQPLRAGPRPAARQPAPEVLELATPDVIAQYIRDRFNVPGATKVTASPLHATPFPPFYEASVVADDGREKHSGNVYISGDARCFVMGNVFAMKGMGREAAARLVREIERIPATAAVRVGPFGPSPYPGLLRATVTALNGKDKQTQPLYVTRNGRTGVLGFVVPFRRDFVQQLLSTRDQPSAGPANAPVTIVEFADLECPSCALLHKVLENQILYAYKTKVRVIFKEFPLPIHQWAQTAALANECARPLDPSAFLKYRDLIFASQADIKAETAREQLLKLGAQVGLDRHRLAACLDSKAPLPRIEAARREAEAVGVNVTPTLFVNGRPVVGAPSAPKLAKIVDEALARTLKR
ncbi:MAG TPA: thioredoxin domain-containing protein [Terriglobia bacterium]|nr:thioredoxin domain-containing protein [Terriglobia bacterium]